MWEYFSGIAERVCVCVYAEKKNEVSRICRIFTEAIVPARSLSCL